MLVQVYEPVDLLGLYGEDPVNPLTRNTYIITGDSGQGMTGCTIGAIVVSDLILGKENAWADVYSPSRLPPLSAVPEFGEVITEVTKASPHFLKSTNLHTNKSDHASQVSITPIN